MRFNDLTEKQIQHITKVYNKKGELSWEKRAAKLGEEFGNSERTIRQWAVKLGLKEKDAPQSEHFKIAKEKKVDKEKNIFLISWAQSNTPVNKGFLANMKAYAEFLDAGIHIIAGRYNNTTETLRRDTQETWDDAVLPYLDANRHDLHKYVSIMSDIKIQPTSANPMASLEGLSGVNSCVFGSPKVQMDMIPVLEGCVPKMMVTSGAVTKKNYTDSAAGKKGEFHHTFGFVILEIQDKEVFHIRQVTADDKTGDFSDLIYRVEESVVYEEDSIAGIVLGDLHYGKHEQRVLDKTHELLTIIKPENVVLHDVFDGDSINHHECKDPFKQYAKEMDGSNSLKKEVDNLLEGLKAFEKYKNVVIVRSNHDDFLDRWLRDGDWKKQTPKNSLEYMEYSAMLLKQHVSGSVKGVIPEVINKVYPKFKCLGRSDSYMIKNVQVSQHGDSGPNGSRGSLMGFRKLNTKMIVGHYHTPKRRDGCLAVGTSTKLRIGYNDAGPSSWLQSHVIIHNNGRTQHINFVGKNKDFTTLI